MLRHHSQIKLHYLLFKSRDKSLGSVLCNYIISGYSSAVFVISYFLKPLAKYVDLWYTLYNNDPYSNAKHLPRQRTR